MLPGPSEYEAAGVVLEDPGEIETHDLLRALASSPAAAASTLRNRAATAEAVSEEEIDEIGQHDQVTQEYTRP